MKKIILILLVLFGGTVFAQTDQLKLSSDIWPPFTNVEGEKSLALDIVQEALLRINVTADFAIDDFNKVMDEIESGKADGSAALWKSADREESMVFSEAYLNNQLILVGRKGSEVDFISFSELKENRIGVVEDYAYGDSLLENKNIQLIYGTSDQQNLERLLSMQVDYILVDAILIQYLLKYQLNDVTEFLEIAELPIITKSLHLAIRKEIPGAEQLIQQFNDAIDILIADGTYNEILELNWIMADVDGDGNVELVLAGDKAGLSAPDNTYNIQSPGRTSGNERYYVDGKMYESWEEVPENYKVPIPTVGAPADLDDANMKIRF